MTEDETVGWHHSFSGHEFEKTLGDSEGQGSLVMEGVPGLPGAPQDEAGLRWKFETSHV